MLALAIGQVIGQTHMYKSEYMENFYTSMSQYEFIFLSGNHLDSMFMVFASIQV